MRINYYNKNAELCIASTLIQSPNIAIIANKMKSAFYFNKYRLAVDATYKTYMDETGYENWVNTAKKNYRELTSDADWLNTTEYNQDPVNLIGHLYLLSDLYHLRKETGLDSKDYPDDRNGLHYYYQSSPWQILRNIKILSEGGHCVLCGEKDDILQCHHRTYERAKQELLSDLTILCKDCHSKFHGKDEVSQLKYRGFAPIRELVDRFMVDLREEETRLYS